MLIDVEGLHWAPRWSHSGNHTVEDTRGFVVAMLSSSVDGWSKAALLAGAPDMYRTLRTIADCDLSAEDARGLAAEVCSLVHVCERFLTKEASRGSKGVADVASGDSGRAAGAVGEASLPK